MIEGVPKGYPVYCTTDMASAALLDARTADPHPSSRVELNPSPRRHSGLGPGLGILSFLAIAGCMGPADLEGIRAENLLVTEDLRIETSDDAGSSWGWIHSIQEGDDGALFVLDGGVSIFAKDGAFRERINGGEEGFHLAASMGIRGDTLLIFDRPRDGGPRVHRFLTDGSPVDKFTFSESTERIRQAVATSDGVLLVGVQPTLKGGEGPGPYSDTLKVRRLDFASRTVTEPLLSVPDQEEYVLGSAGFNRSPLYALSRAIAIRRTGEIYFSHGVEYLIEVLSPEGQTLRTFTRAVEPTVVTEQDFQKSLVDLLEAEAESQFSDEKRMQMLREDYPWLPRPSHRPILGRLLVSPGGMMLVERADANAEPWSPSSWSRWELLDPMGEIIGALEIPPSISPLLLTDQHMFARKREGQSQSQSVVRYEIEPAGP